MARDLSKSNEVLTCLMMRDSNSAFEHLLYQFTANVDITNPKDAWDKFYTYVWRKHFQYAQNIQPGRLQKALQEEMSLYGGNLHYHGNSPWYYVLFSNEKDYTWFILKWS